MRFASRIGSFALGLLLGLVAGVASAAPVVVLSGEAAGLKPGDVVESDLKVEIPAGAILVINDSAGATRTLTGPYSGAIAGDAAAAGAGGGVAASLGRLVASREEEQARLGAIRAAPGQRARDPHLISVARSGAQCLAPGAPARLWRPETLDADSRLAIARVGSGEAAERLWRAGETEIDWPEELPLADGARYLVRLDISPRPVEIELRVAPRGLSGAQEIAAWMGEAGCRRQALQMLDDGPTS